MPPHFTRSTLSFLTDLKANNDRDWFAANKERYEEHVRLPALAFIADFAPHLAEISSNFVADPRPVGGSMFRIYRDVRFSSDKSPYKTHVGLQFRHVDGKDVHAPGFYLGVEPEGSVAAMGMWHPDREALGRVREWIVAEPDEWSDVVASTGLAWYGESLTRAPRGFDSDHPLIDHLKRKDYVLMQELADDEVASGEFLDRYLEICRAGCRFVEVLCEAVGRPF